MKKILSVMLTLAILLGTMVMIPQAASADNVYYWGDTSSDSYIRLESTNSNAYIVLSSFTGVAEVHQHNWAGSYKGTGYEEHYGFYEIVVYNDAGTIATYIWAPSATTNKNYILTDTQVKIPLYVTGTVTVAIRPLTPDRAAQYWRVDSIRRWVTPATWDVTILHSCDVTLFIR